MENLFELKEILIDTNVAAASMVEAFQKLNKSGATPAQNKAFAYAVMAFDIAIEERGIESFTAYDAGTREAILQLHKATVATAYKAITEDNLKN